MEDFRKLFSSEILAVDFETSGLDPTDTNQQTVGVGVSDGITAAYMDLQNISTEGREALFSWLGTKRWIAHNYSFDGAWYYKEKQEVPPYEMCTYAMFRHAATEGFDDQDWSLKTAMVSLLGWPEDNTTVLDTWLKENKLTKGDMWQAPKEILGPYCALDALATFELYKLFKDQLESRFPHLFTYHREEFSTLLALVVEQQFHGFTVNKAGFEEYLAVLDKEIEELKQQFYSFPSLQQHLEKFNAEVCNNLLAAEPKKLKKDGTLTVNWQKWQLKTADAARTQHFNLNSRDQLRWLFFGELGHTTEKKTEKGKLALDKDVLPLLGSEGILLNQYNLKCKTQGYVKAAVNRTKGNKLSISLKTPGTLTGRCSGSGGFNMQQQPKTRSYLENFKAAPGHKLVVNDFDAVEPKVQTQFSRDAVMWKLYGPKAKQNDIYIFNWAHMNGLKQKLVGLYDPNNPTHESIAKVKKQHKKLRGMVKTFTLAAGYGAGPKKLRLTLATRGFEVPLPEVFQMHRDYWQLYGGLKRYGKQLEQQWQRNGGYIINGAGRPIAVVGYKLKDVLNRFVQSTAHDILVRYLWHIQNLRVERGVEMRPVLVDFHDETMWEAPEAEAPKVAAIMVDALKLLNDELGWDIKQTGEPEIVDNLAEVKCED